MGNTCFGLNRVTLFDENGSTRTSNSSLSNPASQPADTSKAKASGLRRDNKQSTGKLRGELANGAETPEESNPTACALPMNRVSNSGLLPHGLDAIPSLHSLNAEDEPVENRNYLSVGDMKAQGYREAVKVPNALMPPVTPVLKTYETSFTAIEAPGQDDMQSDFHPAPTRTSTFQAQTPRVSQYVLALSKNPMMPNRGETMSSGSCGQRGYRIRAWIDDILVCTTPKNVRPTPLGEATQSKPVDENSGRFNHGPGWEVGTMRLIDEVNQSQSWMVEGSLVSKAPYARLTEAALMDLDKSHTQPLSAHDICARIAMWMLNIVACSSPVEHCVTDAAPYPHSPFLIGTSQVGTSASVVGRKPTSPPTIQLISTASNVLAGADGDGKLLNIIPYETLASSSSYH